MKVGLALVRYVIPAAFIVAGQVVLVASDSGVGPVAWAGFTGAGLALLLLNFLFRIGMQGDRERDREEEARRYFDRHGYWPDEARRR